MDNGAESVLFEKKVKRRHSAICKKIDDLLLKSDLSLHYEKEEELLKKFQTKDLTLPLLKLKHPGVIVEVISITTNFIILGLEIFSVLEDKTWNHMCEMFNVLHLRNLTGKKKGMIFHRPVIPALASENYSIPFDFFNVDSHMKLTIYDFYRGSNFESIFLITVIMIIFASLVRFFHLTMLEPTKHTEKRLGIILLSIFAVCLYLFAPLQIMSFTTQQFLYQKLFDNDLSIYTYCFSEFLVPSNMDRRKLGALQETALKKLRICERNGLKITAFTLTVLNIHLILLGIFFHLVRASNEQIHHVVSFTEEAMGIRSEMLVRTKTTGDAIATQKIRPLPSQDKKRISKGNVRSRQMPVNSRASIAVGGGPIMPIDKEFFIKRKHFWKRCLDSLRTKTNKIQNDDET